MYTNIGEYSSKNLQINLSRHQNVPVFERHRLLFKVFKLIIAFSI